MIAGLNDARAPGSRCPECGSPGRPVGLKTVKHLLEYPQSRTAAGEGWLFCPDGECHVYYFQAGGAGAATDVSATAPDAHQRPNVYHAADIKERARPDARGADRLVCYCFGHTAGDIASDARRGRNEIPSAIAAEVKAGMCACEVLNPGGG